jgi:5-methylthioadenosine/S-adenosylhomocysteine deaminase
MRFVADAVVEVTPDSVRLHIPGVVDVVQGRVTWVGGEADAPPTEAETSRIGGLLMPGLVNSHAHTPMTLLRSVGDGLDLHRWLTEAIWPLEANLTDADVYCGMVLGSLEMLLSGVTTSVEMYLHDASLIRAVLDTGGRVVATPGVVGALHGNRIEERIAEISDLFDRYHNPDGRVAVGFGPHSPYDLSPEHVAELAARSRELDTVLHIHLEETEAERKQVLDQHGKSATQLLAEIGALDGRVIAAHGVWLDEADMNLLRDHGVSVAHCPQSNLKLGSGFADIAAMKEAGINVCLGTDGPASNDNLDLWDELMLAPSLARGLTRNPAAVSAEAALLMATAHGGAAIGQPDLGCLTKGSRADLVRVSLDHPSWSPGVTAETLLGHLVFGGTGRDVTDVWVGGDQVIKDSCHVSLDVAAVMDEAQGRARQLRQV